MTPTSPTTTTKKVLRWVSVAVLLACLAAALPAYRALKVWRAHRIAHEAEVALNARNGEAALQKARAAVELAPQDWRCLRTMAQVLARLGQEDAFRYWELADAIAPLSPAEQQQRIDVALALRRFDLAEKYLGPKLKEKDPSAALLRSAANFFSLRGDITGAAQMGRAWLNADRTNINAKIFLARHLLATEDPGVLPEVKMLLGQIVDERHPEWPQALRILASLPNLTEPEIQTCIRLFNRLPASDPKRDFAMIDLHLRLQPARKDELISAAVSYYRTGNKEILLALTRWLSQRGEQARVPDIITSTNARADKDLFLVYADALATQSKWSELEKLLGEPGVPLDPLLVALYQARVAGELKKDRWKDSYWAEVQRLGSKNPEMLWYAAQYAARIGEKEEAIKACRRLVDDPNLARGAYAALIQWTEEKGDSAEVRRLMAEMLRRFPDDPMPANDLAYLDLLSGQNVKEAIATAQRLVEKYPNFLAYRTTLALGHLRSNNRAAAKAVYQDMTIRWPQVAPGWQAVYAAVLGTNGDQTAARNLAREISQKRLRSEERALVQPWL